RGSECAGAQVIHRHRRCPEPKRDRRVAGRRPRCRRGVGPEAGVRGAGAGGSSGQKQVSSVQQLAGDLVAGVAFLKTRPEVNAKRIGIIGHSFAGLTAPIAAVRSNDVAFVITLAGLFTDALVNLERLPPGLRAAATATWTTLAQSSPTLSSSTLESRPRDAFSLWRAHC